MLPMRLIIFRLCANHTLPEQQQLALRFRLALRRAQKAIASGART